MQPELCCFSGEAVHKQHEHITFNINCAVSAALMFIAARRHHIKQELCYFRGSVVHKQHEHFTCNRKYEAVSAALMFTSSMKTSQQPARTMLFQRHCCSWAACTDHRQQELCSFSGNTVHEQYDHITFKWNYAVSVAVYFIGSMNTSHTSGIILFQRQCCPKASWKHHMQHKSSRFSAAVVLIRTMNTSHTSGIILFLQQCCS